jgi:hypothetical protein
MVSIFKINKMVEQFLKLAQVSSAQAADVNASFNIAKSLNLTSATEKKIGGNGGTDTPMRQSNA